MNKSIGIGEGLNGGDGRIRLKFTAKIEHFEVGGGDRGRKGTLEYFADSFVTRFNWGLKVRTVIVKFERYVAIFWRAGE